MRIRLLVLLALWAAPASAADLSKVDRTIGKEPAYATKTPKYCLLVFGPEAKARVWLVLDGDTLYVDRNGSGDLTEKGKRFPCASKLGGDRSTYLAEIREFPVLPEIPTNGGKKYTRFHVTHTLLNKDFNPDNRSDRELKARFEKDPTLTRAGITVYLHDKVRVQAVCEWADRPGDAPVCHIDGPLTMAPWLLPELRCGREPTELQFCLGCRGLGKGPGDAFAIRDYDEVPKDVQPVAEFTFANKNAAGPPLSVKVKLNRC
jgi:hypothetical protein